MWPTTKQADRSRTRSRHLPQSPATVFDFPGLILNIFLSLTLTFCAALFTLSFKQNELAHNAVNALNPISEVVSTCKLA